MSKMVFNGATVQNKSATANRWKQVNPVLAKGELGHESDTGKLKCGDGVAAWNKLPYVSDEGEFEFNRKLRIAVTDALNIRTGGDPMQGMRSLIEEYITDPLREMAVDEYAFKELVCKASGLADYLYVDYAGRASADINGNHIPTTYARKDEIPKVSGVSLPLKKDTLLFSGDTNLFVTPFKWGYNPTQPTTSSLLIWNKGDKAVKWNGQRTNFRKMGAMGGLSPFYYSGTAEEAEKARCDRQGRDIQDTYVSKEEVTKVIRMMLLYIDYAAGLWESDEFEDACEDAFDGRAPGWVENAFHR